jgi:hypothetical protein
VLVIDERAEDDLRDVVSARGELVEHDVFAWNARAILVRRLLDVIEGAGDKGVIGDEAPIKSTVRRGGGRLGFAGFARTAGLGGCRRSHAL